MGQLIFQATLGGQVALVGPNTASSYALNIPTVNGNLVTTGDTGTVTNTMLANSSVTIGSTNVSLGGTATTIAGLTLTGATLGGTFSGTSVTDSGLTSGRVTYAGTGGLLQDSANMTFNGTTLTANILASTNDASIHGLTVGLGGGSVSSNTVVGYQAGYTNSTGLYSTFVGYQAGYTSNAGENTAIGWVALKNATGNANTAIGSQSMYANTSGYQNVAVGQSTLNSNTTGVFNVAVGVQSLTSNISGQDNTAVGYQAGYSNTTASSNTALGYQAGYNNVTGSYNTFLGYQAGYDSSVSGNAFNTCVGIQAGYALSSGTANTFIGVNSSGNGSGSTVTTGSKNTILGGYSGNQGGLDIRISNNYIVLSDGDGNPLAYVQNGGSWYQKSNSATWAITSDIRIKKNVISLESGLNVISALRPVEFDYIENDKHDIGFIAQEYQTVLPAQISEGDDGMLSLNQNLVPYLVKAIQEQQALIVDLQSRLAKAGL